MSGGTKIFLAVFAVLVAALVAYYGFMLPGKPTENVAEDTPAAEGATMTDEPQRPADPLARPEVSVESPGKEIPTIPQGNGTLSRSIEAAFGDADGLPRSSRPLAADEPVLNMPVLPQPSSGAPATRAEPAAEEPRLPASRDPLSWDRTSTARRTPDPAPLEPASSRRRTAIEQPQYTTYTIRPHDTMSSIAEEYLGDANKWSLIAQANPLVDPRLLQIGRTLRIPVRDSTRREEAPRSRSDAGDATIYVVQSGDTLSDIAKAHYGDDTKWPLIYDANRRTIGSDPDHLNVGMRLTIPPRS